MDRALILRQVNDLFIDILDNEDVVLEETSTADDVEDWDSLNYIQLVVAAEKHFKIKFAAKEIGEWANIGAMITSISSKLQTS